MVIKSLWEQIGSAVNNKVYVPHNVVHISANLSPKVKYKAIQYLNYKYKLNFIIRMLNYRMLTSQR